MAHAVASQALDEDPPAAHDQFQRDAWLRLQSSLARTLDDLYLVCEGDAQCELVQSTLRMLEETVDDFRMLAGTSISDSTPLGSSGCNSVADAAEYSSCSEQETAPPADAAAHISRSSGSCSTCCCSNTWAAEGPSSSVFNSSSGKPQASSRLPRSSSTGCNLQSLIARIPAEAPSGSCNCSLTPNTGAYSGVAHCQQDVDDSCCCSDAAKHTHDGSTPSVPADTTLDSLHHKLSSPDRLRRSPSQTKAAADERHAKAERLREQLAEARLARLQGQLTKQQRRAAANKGPQPVSSSANPAASQSVDKLQRSSLLRAAHLRRIRAKAEDESRKVDEVSFINNLTTAGKKADLQQRLEEGEARRAEALAAILAKQQEAAANVREAAERRRAAEAERLAQLEHRQRRKQEVQAKLEEERRAAVAAREAARAHAKAMAQQREVVRQQQATLLRDKVNARLKQAAERRLQHLELIRERAALGKDFDRRDSFAGGPGSGRQSPVGFERPASKAARQARSPVPCDAPAGSSGTDSDDCVSAGRRGGMSRLNMQASTVSLTDTSPGISAESSQLSVSQASTGSGTSALAAGLLPCDVFNQLQGNSQSIAAAGLSAAPSSFKSSMKGARRRMAKAKHKMQQPGCCFQEPEQAQQLSQSPEMQQLLASWAPHLAVLQIQAPAPAACQQGTPAPAAAADVTAGNMSAGIGAAPQASISMSGSPPEQPCACDSSSKSSSATNSPRSSMSSYASACVSTSTFSSTVVGSPAGCCPPNWVLSRSSSCCDCDSQHSASGGAAAACTRSMAVAEEQQREALTALVASARSHVAKQQLLVSHLARRTGLLYRLCEEVLAACGSNSGTGSSGSSGTASSNCSRSAGAQQEAKARQERLQQARLLELLGRLLELPANLDYLLSCGQLLPAFVRSTRVALDHCNSLEADEPSMMTGGEAASRLSMLLQVLVAVLEHTPSSAELVGMQEQLVGFTVAAGLMARLASVFSLFDQPMQRAAKPVPPHVLQCLRLLGGLTAVRNPPDQLLLGRTWPSVAPNAAAVVLEMQATSMAGVLSLLTAVLLNASPTCTPAEASSRALPPNFVEAAHLVMAVLNNVCRLDLVAGQFILACAHHRMEFYHLISFLLSYCLSRWPAPVSPRASAGPVPAAAGQQPAAGAQPAQQPCPATQPAQQPQGQQAVHCAGAACAQQHSSSGSGGFGGSYSSPSKETGRPPGVAAVLHHPIAQLLNQVLLLIGYFCVQHPSNQAMLTWGRSPSILQRLCSLPQDYLQVPELRAVLMPTLLCVCYGAERTCETVAQHFDLEVLLQYVQQQQQQQTQEVQEAKQPATQTRQERRRQRKIQQRQQMQGGQQELEQQLPEQAQQLLQQVSAVCDSAGSAPCNGTCGQQVCNRGKCVSSSSSSGGGVGELPPGGVPGSSSAAHSSGGPCRQIHPGRSRHTSFALCRRFPLELLPKAAQQLHRLGLGCIGGSSTNCLQTHTTSAPQLGCAAQQPCATHSRDCQPHDQQGQQQQEEAVAQHGNGSAAAGPPAAAEAVSLQLQIQRSSAAKLVRCEVVACS